MRRAPTVFLDKNFQWIFFGGLISMLGDQFTSISLPWLALALTRDPMVLGLVLAASSLPRAVLLLAGGVLVDRVSPRTVLIWTKLTNALLLGTLAVLTGSGTATIPAVLALSLGIGVASAFGLPASSAILPRTVSPSLLQAANGVMIGVREGSILIGSVLAGSLVTILGGGSGGVMRGLSLALGFDAFSFAFSSWTMSRVQRAPERKSVARESVLLGEIAQAMRQFWLDADLRSLCLYLSAIEFFVSGPMEVALPIFAKTRLSFGAGSLGLLLAAHGAGMLLGMVQSGRRGLRVATLGSTMLACDAAAGLLILPLGYATGTWEAVILLVPLGAARGLVKVAAFTWIQRRVPTEFLGRTTSLVMLINMGLTPCAAILTGLLLRVATPSTVFAGCGAILVSLVAVACVATPIRGIREGGIDTVGRGRYAG